MLRRWKLVNRAAGDTLVIAVHKLRQRAIPADLNRDVITCVVRGSVAGGHHRLRSFRRGAAALMGHNVGTLNKMWQCALHDWLMW